MRVDILEEREKNSWDCEHKEDDEGAEGEMVPYDAEEV